MPVLLLYERRVSTLSSANPFTDAASSCTPTAIFDCGVRALVHARSARAAPAVLPNAAKSDPAIRARASKRDKPPVIVAASCRWPETESPRTEGGMVALSFGAGAPVTARSTSVARAMRSESSRACAIAFATRAGLGATVAVSCGKKRATRCSESSCPRTTSCPLRPSASPNVPDAVTIARDPLSATFCALSIPFAIPMRSDALSIARLSYCDAAMSALAVIAMVAGEKPRPFAAIFAVIDVCGSRAITVFALNSRIAAARS